MQTDCRFDPELKMLRGLHAIRIVIVVLLAGLRKLISFEVTKAVARRDGA